MQELRHVRIQREDRGFGPFPPPPLKNHKDKGILSNTGPAPLKNHKAAKPAFNIGPSFARQQNTIKMVFRWRADDGPLLVPFGSSFPLSKKSGTPLAKLSGSLHVRVLHYRAYLISVSNVPVSRFAMAFCCFPWNLSNFLQIPQKIIKFAMDSIENCHRFYEISNFP